jgi:hypothetical protein
MSRKQHYLSGAFACFIGSFLIICLPFLLNIFLNFISFPNNGVTRFDVWGSSAFWAGFYDDFGKAYLSFPNLYLYHPQLYNVLFTLILSFCSGIFGVFAYAMSFFLSGLHKLCLFLPVYLLFFLLDRLWILGLRFDLYDYMLVKTHAWHYPFLFYSLLLVVSLFSAMILRKKIQSGAEIFG